MCEGHKKMDGPRSGVTEVLSVDGRCLLILYHLYIPSAAAEADADDVDVVVPYGAHTPERTPSGFGKKCYVLLFCGGKKTARERKEKKKEQTIFKKKRIPERL